MSNKLEPEFIAHDEGAPQVPVTDFSILQIIIPRLWKRAPLSEPELCLEVLDGPYKGVIFQFTKLDVLPTRLQNGMVPTKFETTVRVAPKGFVVDEAFDDFTREVLLAWLSYVAIQDYNLLMKVQPLGKKPH